jgi:hypothetical protein
MLDYRFISHLIGLDKRFLLPGGGHELTLFNKPAMRASILHFSWRSKESGKRYVVCQHILPWLTGKPRPDCPKCGGSGYIPAYNHIAGGICFSCRGEGAA